MIALIIVVFIAIAAIELWLWPERPVKETIVYLVLMVMATALSVLITLKIDLAVPSPFSMLKSLWSKWW